MKICIYKDSSVLEEFEKRQEIAVMVSKRIIYRISRELGIIR